MFKQMKFVKFYEGNEHRYLQKWGDKVVAGGIHLLSRMFIRICCRELWA